MEFSWQEYWSGLPFPSPSQGNFGTNPDFWGRRKKKRFDVTRRALLNQKKA